MICDTVKFIRMALDNKYRVNSQQQHKTLGAFNVPKTKTKTNNSSKINLINMHTVNVANENRVSL